MPTENRSSNTEMVSVLQREDRYIVIKRSDLERISAQHRFEFSKASRVVHERMFAAGAPARRFLVIESDWPEYEPTWAAIERRVTGSPAPQPHPEPIAWMVGTAFWWTKEEAERDADATGLPVVAVGPMTGAGDIGLAREMLRRALRREDKWALLCSGRNKQIAELHAQLTEALRVVSQAHMALIGYLPAHRNDVTTAAIEACADLSASAEPSAPNDCAICRDLGDQCKECEESDFREWADRHFAAADYRKTDAGVFIQDWMRHAYGAWCARGALVRQS